MRTIVQEEQRLRVECTCCSAKLLAPRAAIGETVRCPGCGAMVLIPQPAEELEEMISDWIQEDVEEMWGRHDNLMKRAVEDEREKIVERDKARAANSAMISRRAARPDYPPQVKRRPETPVAATPVEVAVPATPPKPAAKFAMHGIFQRDMLEV